MANEIDIKYTLDQSDVVSSVKAVDRALAKNEEQILRTAEGLTTLAKGGTKTVDVTLKQIDAFTTLTTTIRKTNGELTSQTTLTKKNEEAQRKAAASAKALADDAPARRLQAAIERQNKVNLERARIYKVMKSDLTAYQRVQEKATVAAKNATAAAKRQRAAYANQNKAVQSVTLSLSGMARLVAVQLTHRAISAMVRGIREGLAEALQLQKRVAEIQTIAQDRPIGFQAWSEGIREVSDSFGFDILDVAESSYQALSNQVVKGAESFKFLAEAGKFAIVTNSSLTDSVNLLSSAMNSYGLGSEKAEQTAASLFKTIELGRVRASEISNTLGRVTIVGSQLGISLDELNTLLAQTSVKGLNARQSLTQILGVMNSLLKPTPAMAGFFRDIGVESGQAAIETYGLSGVFKEMIKSTNGQANELAKLVPRIRGLSSALVAFTDDGQEYTKTLAKMTDAQSSYLKGTEITVEGAGLIIEKALTQIKNVFIKEIGEGTVIAIAKAIKSFKDYEATVRGVVQYINKNVSTYKALGAALEATGIGMIAAVSADIARRLAAEEIATIKLNKEYEKRTAALDREVQNRAKISKEAVDASAQEALKVTAIITKAYNKSITAYDESINTLNGNLKDSFKDVEKALKANVKSITDSISQAEDRSKKLRAGTKSLIADIQSTIFEEGLNRKTPNQQVQAIVAEIKRVELERKEAVKSGATETAQALLKQEKDLVDDLIAVDKSRQEELKKNNAEVQKLEDERAKKRKEGLKGKELREYETEYKKTLTKLAIERTKLESKSTGVFAENYKKLYTDIIEIAKTQQDALLKSETARITKLKELEKAAAVEVSTFKARLRVLESFDFDEDVGSVKDPKRIAEIIKQRQDDLAQIAISASKITDKGLRASALQQINQLKTLEQQKAAVVTKTLELKLLSRQIVEQKKITQGYIDQEAKIQEINNDVQSTIDKIKAQAKEPFLSSTEFQRVLEARRLQLEIADALTSKQNARLRSIEKEKQLLIDISRITNSSSSGQQASPQRFATGGRAYGSDSINAMLSPGEFVVNAASSRKFYSQLLSMNSRGSAQNFNSGGAVTTGDININMSSSGSESYDVQRMGRQLRREIRRGTVKL